MFIVELSGPRENGLEKGMSNTMREEAKGARYHQYNAFWVDQRSERDSGPCTCEIATGYLQLTCARHSNLWLLRYEPLKCVTTAGRPLILRNFRLSTKDYARFALSVIMCMLDVALAQTE